MLHLSTWRYAVREFSIAMLAFTAAVAVFAIPFYVFGQDLQLPPEAAQVGQDIKSVHDAYGRFGIPGGAAATFVVLLRLLRSQRVQGYLGGKDPRLTWDAWPFWVKFLVASVGAGASGALAAAVLPGAALSWPLFGTSIITSALAIFLNETTKAGGQMVSPWTEQLPTPLRVPVQLALPPPRRPGLEAKVPTSWEEVAEHQAASKPD